MEGQQNLIEGDDYEEKASDSKGYSGKSAH